MKDKRLISFGPGKLKKLKREAKKLEISVSELLRRIIDEWFVAQETSCNLVKLFKTRESL